MQTLKNWVWLFCTACFCAEVLELLTGRTREHGSIKAVAGLYIMVVTLRGMFGMAELTRQPFPEIEEQAVHFGSFEEILLQQTEERLEKELGEMAESAVGYPLFPEVSLAQKEGEVTVERVTLEDVKSKEERKEVERLFQSVLGETEIVYRKEES